MAIVYHRTSARQRARTLPLPLLPSKKNSPSPDLWALWETREASFPSAGGERGATPPLTSLRLDLTQLDVIAAVSRASGTISAIDAALGTLSVQAIPGIAELYLGTVSNANFIDRNSPIDPVNELTPATVAALLER